MGRGNDECDEVQGAVLDALVERPERGMTIFELRSRVDFDIETLEPALNRLRDDGLITVEYDEERSVIRPDEDVLPSDGEDAQPSGWLHRLLRSVFRR